MRKKGSKKKIKKESDFNSQKMDEREKDDLEDGEDEEEPSPSKTPKKKSNVNYQIIFLIIFLWKQFSDKSNIFFKNQIL